MRNISVSVLKIITFIVLWAALTGGVFACAVALAGDGFYAIPAMRIGVEIALTFTVLIPLIVMARFVDKRSITTIGFGPPRLFDLLTGTIIGAAIFAVPVGVLVAIGAATIEPDFEAFAAVSLALALITCFFNVVTQELIVRSYIFQELWTKYGAWVATIVTTFLFVAMHAAALMQGTQGLIAGLNIFVASLMLSLACVRTGQLWLAIGLHMGWNGLQGPVLGINVTGTDLAFGGWHVFQFSGDALLTGGSMGVEGGLVGLIGPVIGLAIVAFAFKQQPKPNFASAPK